MITNPSNRDGMELYELHHEPDYDQVDHIEFCDQLCINGQIDHVNEPQFNVYDEPNDNYVNLP